MTPAEKGRYCASCQKTILDFTKLSDKEIAAVAAVEKNICVAAYPSQLDRRFGSRKSPLFAASLVLAGMLTLNISPASAQTTSAITEEVSLISDVKLKKGEFIVRGTVSDGVNPLADIVIMRMKKRGKKKVKMLGETRTAVDGTFSFNIKKGEYVMFAHTDYEPDLVEIVDETAEIIVVLRKKEPGIIRLGRLQTGTSTPFKHFDKTNN